MLAERFGVSERRACRVVGQHRSTQRAASAAPGSRTTSCARRLRAIARAHPRWGWQMAHAILRREGWTVNNKRIQRLWRDEGLRRPPQRAAQTAPGPTRRRAERLRRAATRTTCGRWTSSSTRPPTAAG